VSDVKVMKFTTLRNYYDTKVQSINISDFFSDKNRLRHRTTKNVKIILQER
jgi:hypothetical protein